MVAKFAVPNCLLAAYSRLQQPILLMRPLQ